MICQGGKDFYSFLSGCPRIRAFGYLAVMSGLSVSFISCGKNKQYSPPIDPSPASEPADALWLASRMASALRGGRPLPPSELNLLKVDKSL